MRFPPKIEYEVGISNSGEPVFENTAEYLLWVRDIFIQDTPFTYRDVEEIHQELQKLRPDRYFYRWVTVRAHLRIWREAGIITVLDGHDNLPQNHMLMWTYYYNKRLLEVKKGQYKEPPSKRFESRVLELLGDKLLS